MNRKFAGFALFLLFTISCGDIKTTSYFTQPDQKISQYSAIEVHDFETADERFPADGLTQLAEVIAEKLRNELTGFNEIVHGTVTGTPDERTLVLLGEVTDFHPAGDVKYERGSLKFGEVEISTVIALVDKATGEQIAEGEINTFSSLGFLRRGAGGSSLYDEIADEIVDFVKKHN